MIGMVEMTKTTEVAGVAGVAEIVAMWVQEVAWWEHFELGGP